MVNKLAKTVLFELKEYLGNTPREQYITDSEIEGAAEKEIVNDDLSWEVDYARQAFIKGARWVRDEYEKVRRGDSGPQE